MSRPPVKREPDRMVYLPGQLVALAQNWNQKATLKPINPGGTYLDAAAAAEAIKAVANQGR